MFSFIKRLFGIKPKSSYGLSFDSKVSLKQLPNKPSISPGKFCHLNKDLGFFEIVSDNPNNSRKKQVLIREICTDNEHLISYDLLDFLFTESAIPEECRF